ncbi:hypothetical protein [Nostoc parmelioides]|uniref:Uncharacterized protein n=1 Tax=Nostoc parmelioides FACHB-3921 TaxID=2692909 RepID=A0ABR8BQ86_9NOSO|nr:hypothetical protein [Nostoc parmelioides]MBD2255834.1 hypothetical protein [Nostoc parmelioides FACHB-3921]
MASLLSERSEVCRRQKTRLASSPNFGKGAESLCRSRRSREADSILQRGKEYNNGVAVIVHNEALGKF